MKKILALVLILTMASAANALVVQLSVDSVTNGAGVDQEIALGPAGTATIGVVSDTDNEAYVRMIDLLSTDNGDYGSLVVKAAAGSDADTYDYLDALGTGHHTLELTAASFTGDIVAGTHFELTYTNVDASQTTPVVIELLTQDLSTVLDTVTIVPEPATIALLSLGGLLLRRRK
jgi:hypothetical protein